MIYEQLQDILGKVHSDIPNLHPSYNDELQELKNCKSCDEFAKHVLAPEYCVIFMQYDPSKESILFFESIIAKSAENSFYYAQDILKAPFIAGENIIASSAEFSLAYAKNVLNDRFILGESTIENSKYRYEYDEFIESLRRWEEEHYKA